MIDSRRMSRTIEDPNQARAADQSRGQYQPLGSGSLKDVHDSGFSPDGPQEEGHSSNRRIIGTCVFGILLGFAAAAFFLVGRVQQGPTHELGIGLVNECQGKDCTSFDCSKDKDDWVAKWPVSKKLFCCGMSCLAASMDTKQHHAAHAVHSVHEAHVPHAKHRAHEEFAGAGSSVLRGHGTVTATTTTATVTSMTVTPFATLAATTEPEKGVEGSSTTLSEANSLWMKAQKDPTYSKQSIYAATEPLKGISYCPVPVKTVTSLTSDDWMTDVAKPLWSAAGRGDLQIMRGMGANAVRLYGNNPELDHETFLDEALRNDLQVIPGMSDFPYTQDPDQNCMATEYNCFSKVKKQYMENLKNGFLKNGRYHPALSYFILINEPDLKIPKTADAVLEDSKKMAKAIISAFDAVLDAEKDLSVKGPFINFTVTFSYAICPVCPSNQGLPALGQMQLIQDAMMYPEKYDYKPKNFLYAAYLRRWANSFNTANGAGDLKLTFFSHYEKSFGITPVFIGEYHKPGGSVLEEVQIILQLAKTMPLFLGINFFEFQVSYWKGGSEMSFGLFGLGGYPIGKFGYVDGRKYTSWCLSPQIVSGTLLPEALATAYGGQSPDVAKLCLPQAETVPLSTLGYNLIVGLKDLPKFQAFVGRVASHLGSDVLDPSGLEEYAQKHLLSESSGGDQFQELVNDLRYTQSAWLHLSSHARCVADRNASMTAVEKAIRWGCTQLGSSCSDIDAACHSVFSKGDWVFSRYYKSVHKGANALEQCNFGGAAVFSSPKMYHQFADPRCVDV